MARPRRLIGLAVPISAATALPPSIAAPGTTPGGGESAAALNGWQLRYSEDFQDRDQYLNTPSARWSRYTGDQPFDTVMDDYGAWWKNDYGPNRQAALHSYALYRKEVQFAQESWLTAALSARDWNNSGTPQRPPTSNTVDSAGHDVLKIGSPVSYAGAMIPTTRKLPPEYRLEYGLKTINFGGERNGRIYYEGRENGYSTVPGERKTQFPYAEGIGTKGWNSQITTNPCDWQSVTNGPHGYNASHLLGIVDFAHPQSANLHFWHCRRKILMDSFAQHPDRIGTGSGGRVCDPTANTYYAYRDSMKNIVDMWINGLPNWSRGTGGITGNSQWFMTTCSGGVASAQVSPSAAAEVTPQLMPNSDVFAIERDKADYTEEVTGTFLHGGYRAIRCYRDFIIDNVPIWYYSTPDQYGGRYNHTLVQNGAYNHEEWPDQWPAGSAYPSISPRKSRTVAVHHPGPLPLPRDSGPNDQELHMSRRGNRVSGGSPGWVTTHRCVTTHGRWARSPRPVTLRADCSVEPVPGPRLGMI